MTKIVKPTKGGYLQSIPSWFDQTKYRRFTQLSDPNRFDLWRGNLLLRNFLKNPESGITKDQKQEFIKRLILDPTDNCGFDHRFVTHHDSLWDPQAPYGQAHEFGTPTVSPTRWAEIMLSDTTASPAPSATIDDLTSKQNLSFKFLTVNMAGNDEQIKTDFAKWLRLNRQTLKPSTPYLNPATLLEKWASCQLMCLIDLIAIIGPSQNEKISKAKAIEWVIPGYSGNETFRKTTLSEYMDLALSLSLIPYLHKS